MPVEIKQTIEVNQLSLKDFLEKEFMTRAQKSVEKLKEKWPVDTGLSRDSFFVQVGDGTVEVMNSTEYAEYVHRAGENDIIVKTELPQILEENMKDLDETVVNFIKSNFKTVAK